MQCPNAIYIDSNLLKKDTFWHIERNLATKAKDQVRNGGVRRENAVSKTAVLAPKQQHGLGAEGLMRIIRSKISQKTQNSDRWSNVYKLFDRPNQGLSKAHLTKKLHSWGVVPEEADINGLFEKWGATRGVVDFRFFLEQVMGSDYTDADQKVSWNFAPAKKKVVGRATQRQTQRASGAIDQHMQQTRKRRLQAQIDPSTGKAHQTILDKIGQASSLGGHSEHEYLQRMLKKNRLPASGVLSIHQFNDFLMIGLGLRLNSHQVQQIIRLHGQGHHGKIAVFEMLLNSNSKTQRRGRNQNRTQRTTHRNRQFDANFKLAKKGRGMLRAGQLMQSEPRLRGNLGQQKRQYGVQLPALGVSNSMPVLHEVAQCRQGRHGNGTFKGQQVHTDPGESREAHQASRLSRESEELRKIRLEKEILQLKANILDQHLQQT